MEFFEGHAELENLLEKEPARVVNELRNRVQGDLASNGHAWLMIGHGLTKLGFGEQGQESISYGESLLSTSNVTETEEPAELLEDDSDREGVHNQEPSDSMGHDAAEQLENQEYPDEGASIDSIEDNPVMEERSTNVVSTPDYSQDSEAIMLMSTGDYNGAIEAWTRLIKIGESAGRWNGLAESLEALGYSNRAIRLGSEPHLPRRQ